MTNPENAPAAAVDGGDDAAELEEYSDDFKCCVCLDLIYKPVVLACGHISCFWCVFEAMDSWQESRCPVCRHSYYHFPSICWLLHSVLLKLYPKAYRIRESQVAKVEKSYGTSSPQFENYLAVSHGSEQMASQCHTMEQGKDRLDTESLEPVPSENNVTTTTLGTPSTASDQITKNADVEGTPSAGSDHVDICYKQISINDLLCSVCKELLCRPVVLNCGHVFCEACIVASNNKPCRCPVCKSMHPNGFPKVCLVLDGFLKQHVSEEYAARIDKLKTCELGNSSTASVPQSSTCSSVPMDEHLCSSGHKIHFGVGCDCCGMCPLMGNRYRCTDCVEKIGFDLCEDCYNSSSNLPGRFNQQHKPDHKFEVLEPQPIIILSADFSEDYEPEEHQSDGSTAHDLSLDTQQDPEGEVAGPVHANDASDGNEDFGPTL